MPAAYLHHTTVTGRAATLNAAAPTGLADGHALLAFHHCDDPGTMTIDPAGATWTLGATMDNTATERGIVNIWWKFAAGEPGTYTFNQSVFSDTSITVLAATGVDAGSAPVFSAPSVNTVSQTTYTSPGVTPAGADDLEVRFAGHINTGIARTITFGALTPALTSLTQISSGGGGSTHRIGHRQLTSAAATANVTITLSGSVRVKQAITVALKSGSGIVTPPVQGWGVPV